MIVVGIGNELRRDDGAGPAVIGELRRRGLPNVILSVSDGEPARLIELWSRVDVAVVVDAARTAGGAPGAVHESDALAGVRPNASSHALGLGEALRLGEALDRMPATLRTYVIEAADFDYGEGLTPSVARATIEVADRISALARSLRIRPGAV